MDNASSDETAEIVRTISGADERVRYVRHDKNIGMAANFNSCIEAARGDLVQILCADDVLEPDAVTGMVRELCRHGSAALAVCSRLICNERLEIQRLNRLRGKSMILSGPDLMRECFAYGNRIGEPSAVMFRREMAGSGFDDHYSQVLDLVMWFHLLERGPAVVLPEPLCRIRTHPGQQSVRNIESGRVLLDKQRLFREFGPRLSRRLGLMERLAWDARMASTCARTPGAADAVPAEVFHPGFYRWALAPAARAGWAVRTAF